MAQGGTGQSRYYIGSLIAPSAPMPESIRDYWGIENCLYCTVDVIYREDQCRVRKVHAPQNVTILRHISHDFLKCESSLKTGIQCELH